MTTAPVAVRPGEQVHPARDRHRAAVRVLPRRRDEHARTGRRAAGPRAARGRRRGRGSSRRPSPSNVRRRCGLDGSSIASVRPSDSHSRAAVANAPCAPAVTTTCSGVARTARDMPRYAASSARSRGSPSGQRYVVAGSGSDARSRHARGRSRSQTADGNRSRLVEPVRKSNRGREWVPSKNGRRGPADGLGQDAGPSARTRPGSDRGRSRAAQVGQPGRHDRPPPRAAPRGIPRRSAARRPSSPSPRPTPEVPGVGPDPGEPCPGPDPPVEDRPAERDLDLAVERQARRPVEDDRRIGHPGSPIPAFPFLTRWAHAGFDPVTQARQPHPARSHPGPDAMGTPHGGWGRRVPCSCPPRG